MLHFNINEQRCTRCGLCARDCPVRVINLNEGTPNIALEKEPICIKCLHCLAVCPTGAVSILGLQPEQSLQIGSENYPDPMQLETLIKGRRSIRHFREDNLDPGLLQKLLDVAWYAPTGINARQVRFTVIDNREAMAVFRAETYAALARLSAAGQIPENRAMFAGFVNLWQEKGIDVLFRGAPHLVVASAPRACPTPVPDGLIALTYFELYAQSQNVGTVWNGLVKWAIDELVPELRERLAIPADHVIGYAMAFGKPAVRYYRTVQHAPADIVRFKA